MKEKKSWLAYGFIFAAILLLGFLWRSDGEVDGAEEEPHEHSHQIKISDEELKNAKIGFTTVGPQVIEESFTTSGKVLLNVHQQAYVVPRVEGIVVKVLRGSGSRVKKGEILAWIDSVSVGESKARYLKALKAAEHSQAVFESEKSLNEKQYTPQREYLKVKRDYEEAQVEVTVARQKLQGLGLSDEEIEEVVTNTDKPYSLYPLKSPIDGTNIKVSLTVGELVGSNKEAFLISDIDNLHVELTVSPKDRQRVKLGQRCIVSAINGCFEGEGVIDSVSPTMDKKTRLGKARCRLPNEERLWIPGNYISARIITSEKMVPLAVAKEAVKNYEGCSVIFVRNGEGIEAKEVCLGRSDNRYVEILGDLEEGAQIVTDNAFLIKAQMTQSEGGGGGHHH